MNSSACESPGSANTGPSGTSYEERGPRVLIVDDEADVVQALKTRLETAGCRALTAADGAEALELLRRSSVDLVLTDLMMPNLDGLELTRRVRQDPNRPPVPVLLFSCNDDPATRELALEFGARDYLSKTLGAREIVSRIQEILFAAKTAANERAHGAYGTAEADLIAQLRAVSDMSSAAPHPPDRDDPPQPAPAGEALAGDDLLKLTTALDRHVEAPQDSNRHS